MTYFLAPLILFWLKAFGLIVFITVGVVLVLAMGAKIKRQQQKGQLHIENITEKFDEQYRQLQAEILSKKDLKRFIKIQKQNAKARPKSLQKKLFVLEFKGGIQAEEVEGLAETITALLQIATEEDHVLLKLNSPGGVVHGYGLAAAQLARIRHKGLKLVIAVDQVAASGGYLMASVGHEIIASPFAVIGSIGVIAQVPNFYRLLKDKGIDFEQITAGNYKRTVTMFGENSEEDRAKLKEQLETIHGQFKHFIKEYRPQIDLEAVATGEYWLAKHALELGLIDKLQVSEDYILSAYQQGYQLYEMKYIRKKTLSHKLSTLFHTVIRQNSFLS